ncbi:MAG: nucleotidyltransferase family protein [Desulfobacterales bacterium]|nr:nucleotidyltransferase family protein [Desulfobacterales bacterium]
MTQFPPELSTLIRLSNRRIPPGQLDRVWYSFTGPFNWDSFTEAVRFHRTCAPVYRNLTTYFSRETPPGILKKLKQQNLRRLAKGLKYTAETIKLAGALKKQGIPCLFYKGACLSKLLYNDPAERFSGDIDLLISPGSLKHAERLLFSMGYARTDPPVEFRESNFGYYRKIRIHATYRSPDNIPVELHWQLCFVKELCPASFESLWQKKQYLSVNGCEIPTLDNLHTAMLLFIHGANHAWQRLFWLNDIAAFHENSLSVDLRLLADTARKNRIDRFLDQAFLLLNQWYGLTPPPDLDRLHDRRRRPTLKIIHLLYRSEMRPAVIFLVEAQKLLLYDWYHGFLYARARLRAKYNKKRLAIDENSELLGHLKNRLSL